MFTLTTEQLPELLSAFGITETPGGFEELERYHYEKHDPASREVRLIVKVTFEKAPSVVLKFKNESGVTKELIEAQCGFSELLRRGGITVARFRQCGGQYVLSRNIGGYDLLITAEEFRSGQIKTVTAKLAERTGAMLAKMHNLSEHGDCHVDCPVIFDPFSENDLFSFKAFTDLRDSFTGADAERFERICEAYEKHMEALAPLRSRPKYAVQGDISDCNMFLTAGGELGIYDFNRCGDNVLFCDAVMQGVFESRLMEYGRQVDEAFSAQMLERFFAGYEKLRRFTPEEKEMLPHLLCVISAFWYMDLDGISGVIDAGDTAKASRMLGEIERKITGAPQQRAPQQHQRRPSRPVRRG